MLRVTVGKTEISRLPDGRVEVHGRNGLWLLSGNPGDTDEVLSELALALEELRDMIQKRE